MTRHDWHRLLPLVAQVRRQRPDVPLPAVLTDRVRSAHHLPGVLAWRLWRLLRQPPPQETRPDKPSRQNLATAKDAGDWDQHLSAVRTIGLYGP